MLRNWTWLAAVTLMSAPALAQPPPSQSPAERMAARFPQPVRVGDLLGREVLKPTEAQNVLGRVKGFVRRADGGLDLVMAHGGLLGIGARPIAVPIEAVALVGPYLSVLDFTPEQLAAFPSFDDAKAVWLPPGETVSVALTRPFH